jgi:hypothetical protein
MEDTITPAKDIFEYLLENGIGVEGETLFYHNSPDGLTEQVCVMDSGGFDPNIYLDPDDKIRRPTIQISVRGTKYGFDAAYTKAQSIVALIDQQYNLIINSTRYICIHSIGDINDLGEDTNECPKLTMNFFLEMAAYIPDEFYIDYYLLNHSIGVYDIDEAYWLRSGITYSYGGVENQKGQITVNGLEQIDSKDPVILRFETFNTNDDFAFSATFIPGLDVEFVFKIRTSDSFANYQGFYFENLRDTLSVTTIYPGLSYEVTPDVFEGQLFTVEGTLIGRDLNLSITMNGTVVLTPYFELDLMPGNTDSFQLELTDTELQYFRGVDTSVETPDYIFENDYTGDPIGAYNYSNSDYADPGLEFLLLSDSEDYRGEISSAGLVNQFSQTMAQFIGQVSVDTTVTTDYIMSSPYTSGYTGDKMRMGILATDTLSQGLVVESWVDASDGLILGTATGGQIIMAGFPDTNWLGKKITGKLETTDGQNLTLTGYIDDVEIDSIIIDFLSVQTGTYQVTILEGTRSIAVTNMIIDGTVI